MQPASHERTERRVTDGQSPRFPVSVKGVITLDGRVVLLRNEREEWELPGGKLDPGEQPPTCLAREIEEELGLTVRVETILDSWLYNILGQVEVVIVTYGCRNLGSEEMRLSAEHKEIGLFRLDEIEMLPMPDGYRQSIKRWIDPSGISSRASTYSSGG
jgi:8-oxo-dGTP pyrophosphatase MutT (NUDIX family)